MPSRLTRESAQKGSTVAARLGSSLLGAWGLERQGDLGQPEVVGQWSSGQFGESTQPVVDGVAMAMHFYGCS